MKKNILFIFLAAIGLLQLISSCQKTPDFPDPGFTIDNQNVEIRRDTADFYNIKLQMNVPNKVKEIDLVNAVDYSVLKTINSYNGQSNFEFNYKVDLTPFTKDTVLYYIIKVVDMDNRSFNRGITISVKGFSFPEIKLVGGTNIAIVAPAYYVKGLVTTGLNAISSIQVLYNDVEQYSYTPPSGTVLHQLDFKQLVFVGNLQSGQVSTIKIVIKDDKGQQSTTIIYVKKSDQLKKPYRINYTNSSGILINITPSYDAQDRIVGFDFYWTNTKNNYRNDFHYNSLGMVDTVRYRSIAADGTYTSDSFTYFNYVAGTKQLSSIESQQFTYSGGNVSTGTKTVKANTFVYDATGTKVVSFKTSSVVPNIYYSDPFNLGENVFGEYWQLSSYMTSNTQRRQHREDYDPVLIPTYTEGLPPFYDNQSVVFGVLNDIFWHKYMMTKTVHSDPTYTDVSILRAPSYTYDTDDEGNITAIYKTYTGGGYTYAGKTETYYFFY